MTSQRGVPRFTGTVRSALVSDALDGLGYRDQCLHPEIRAQSQGLIVIGRAFPVTVVRVDDVPDIPYVGLLKALDDIGPGDIYMISSDGAPDVALFGELLSTIAVARGAVGAICDGYVRDQAKIRALGFPVFARGTVPLDIHGRFEVTGHNTAITVGGIEITPGDLVIGDDDGVVVVPRAAEEEVITLAQAKAHAEDGFKQDVAGGVLPSTAWATHRVL